MIDYKYSPAAVKELLNTNGLRAQKKLGQNFLTDRNVVEKIINVTPNEREAHAIEIGGGLGALTFRLREKYSTLTTVEYDKGLFAYLTENIDSVNLVHEDILKYTIESKCDIYGNIPYNISSPIIEWLLIENAGKWNYGVFLVQDDFANRLLAKAGDENYSALTLLANFAANVKKEFYVPETVFFPKPKVGSMVISLTPKNTFDTKMFSSFKGVVKSAFHSRRKTIKNNLTKNPYHKYEKAKVDQTLKELSISENIRAEELDANAFYAIAQKLNGS